MPTEKNKLKERVFRESPFCYQEKDAFRLIRNKTKGSPRLNNILRSIYVVLTERASDVGKNTFSDTWSILSTYSGIGVRTFKRYASYLEEYELIKIERTKTEHPKQPNKIINKPNKFTILSTQNTLTNVGACLAGPGGCLTGPQLEDKLLEINTPPPLEETPEKQKINVDNKNEWFQMYHKIKGHFSNPENFNLLISNDKEIIKKLPEILKDKEKTEFLQADIAIVYSFSRKETVNKAFLKKIINLDDILDKVNPEQLEKGLEIAQKRCKSESLSYLKGILWKASRT